MQSYINEAADLIAEFNPSAANVFRHQPFHRVAMAEAFAAGFRRHSEYSRSVCEFVAMVAAEDQHQRAVEAEIEEARAA